MSGTNVMLFRSTDAGAPVLSGTAGALIAVLDACLKDGYNSKTITLARTGNTVTATCATAHGYAADGLTKINISGAGQPEYNGDFQISNVTTLTFDFTVTGTPATPATGTISAKVAPIGWGKTYSGTNKAAYRSSEATGTRLYLRVNDTTDSGRSAGLCGYETMTDVDTGTGLFPTSAQLNTGLVITKSDVATSAARPWILVGDGYEFLFFTNGYNQTSYSNQYDVFHFGDPASELLSDPFGCLIYGNTALMGVPGANANAESTLITIGFAALPGHYYARSYTQSGTSVGATKVGNWGLCGGNNNIGSYGLFAYPCPANNGLYISPLFASDGAVIRGQLKCIWQPLQNKPLGHAAIVDASASPIGRRLYSVKTTGYSQTLGEHHIDIDGPWR